MKSILILAFSDLRHDARVSRQVDFLTPHGNLTIVCFDAPGEWTYEVIRIPRIKPGFWTRGIAALLLLLRIFPSAYKVLYGYPSLTRELINRSFDLVVANDIECLALAATIRGKARILFDAHEYAPRHFEDKWVWRIFFQRFNIYLCKTYLPQADVVTTVGQGLAEAYATNFGVKPIVITNANYYHDITPSPVIPGKIRLVHHGAANPSRQLELMIRMMELLDERFELTLMLIVPPIANKKTRGYLDRLKQLVGNNPRIHLVPAVPSNQVVDAIRQHDIGVFLLPPVNFNYANTLPNKFFDFVQARLGIAIGPTPEMAALVKQYDLGVISDDFTPESLASRLGSLSETDIERMKGNAHLASHPLSADANRKIMGELMRGLLNPEVTK